MWSTCCGEMSFLGPRPQRAAEVALYDDACTPPADHEAGYERAVAGQRPVQPQLGRQHPPRSVLRGELVAYGRHSDSLAYRAGCGYARRGYVVGVSTSSTSGRGAGLDRLDQRRGSWVPTSSTSGLGAGLDGLDQRSGDGVSTGSTSGWATGSRQARPAAGERVSKESIGGYRQARPAG